MHCSSSAPPTKLPHLRRGMKRGTRIFSAAPRFIPRWPWCCHRQPPHHYRQLTWSLIESRSKQIDGACAKTIWVAVHVHVPVVLELCASRWAWVASQMAERTSPIDQSEKFLDLGTVTRPPSSIYARVNCFVIPRVHKNKSMQRLISSLWGTGTAEFQVTWLLRIAKAPYRCGSAARNVRARMSGVSMKPKPFYRRAWKT